MKVATAPERAVMVVTDRRRMQGGTVAGLAGAAARAGAAWLQVREKDLGGAALLGLVREAAVAAAGSSLRIVVNGRPDVARLAGVHGVHLPEHGLPAGDVRRAFPELTVGVSCHARESVQRAEQAGAHYVLLGPVFATAGKDRPLGLDAFAAAARSARVPVLAIGGITAANAGSVWAAGAAGVAAIGVFRAGSVAEAVRLLRHADASP
jgi:thiamine-phosphate pyrophosphorylase